MLQGRCIVVTGASGNLGRVVCARLAQDGARVVALVRAGAAWNPAALTGIANNAAYAATKAGVVALTKALAEEGARVGDVRASCVAPGTMRTTTNAEAMPKADQEKWVPMEDVAEAIAFLCAPGSVNGAVIPLPSR